jgi:hypothetical protein
MKKSAAPYKLFSAVSLAMWAFTGCESTDGGGSVSGSVYYGAGFYDPWYYGDYDDVDIIVTPPERPDAPARPEHPIATPPSTPRPTPMPSIPSTPRVAPRGGGRR